MFIAHALVFSMALAVAGLMLLLRLRAAALPHVWLYALLAGIAPASAVWLASDRAVSGDVRAVEWDPLWVRLLSFPLFTWTATERVFLIFAVAALAGPLILRSKINSRTGALAPLAALTGIWALAPTYAFGTALLYERFAVSVLPFYALAFTRRMPKDANETWGRSFAAQAVLASCCLAFLATTSVRVLAFAREAEDVDRLFDVAERRSARTVSRVRWPQLVSRSPAYIHYPVWYQVEHGGFVEFNFAWYHPQVVRYRGEVSPIKPNVNASPESFRWDEHGGGSYEYVFVRVMPGQSPFTALQGATCRLRVAEQRARWFLLQQTC